MSIASTRLRSVAESRRGRGLRAAAALLAALLCACAGTTPAPDAARDPDSTFLLDVEIVQFDPGRVAIAEEERSQIATLLGLERVEAVTSIDIRRAEARYVPVHLRHTLLARQRWGSIWVVPEETRAADLTITGRIADSDGERIALDVQVVDATGYTWLRRSYRTQLDTEDYERAEQNPGTDPAQELYDQIAADLEVELGRADGPRMRRIRDVAELRFAQRFAADSFSGYLTSSGSLIEVRRLPARSDPMLRRVRQLAAREQLFLGTLSGHYEQLYSDMQLPYINWRRYSRDEVSAFREIVNSARLKILGGTALVVGGLVAGPSIGGDGGRLLRVLLAAGGVASVAQGFSEQRASNLHAEALKELGTSFDGEVSALVVSVDQNLVRLSGTAEAQYEKWRRILQDLYEAESTVAGEMRVYLESPPASTTSVREPAEAEPKDAERGAARRR